MNQGDGVCIYFKHYDRFSMYISVCIVLYNEFRLKIKHNYMEDNIQLLGSEFMYLKMYERVKDFCHLEFVIQNFEDINLYLNYLLSTMYNFWYNFISEKLINLKMNIQKQLKM